MVSQKSLNPPLSYATAAGKIDYTLMNDYMFHRTMERSQNVLKGLLCALLRLSPNDTSFPWKF